VCAGGEIIVTDNVNETGQVLQVHASAATQLQVWGMMHQDTQI
jgi:hypothetical protein